MVFLVMRFRCLSLIIAFTGCSFESFADLFFVNVFIVESCPPYVDSCFIHEVIFSGEKSPEFWLPFLIFPVKVLSVEEDYMVGLVLRAGIVIENDRFTPSECYLIPVTNLRALFNLS